jgi:hypothetical protein
MWTVWLFLEISIMTSYPWEDWKIKSKQSKQVRLAPQAHHAVVSGMIEWAERDEYLKNYEAWKEHEHALSTKRQLAYLYSKYHEASKEMHAWHSACFMNSHESWICSLSIGHRLGNHVPSVAFFRSKVRTKKNEESSFALFVTYKSVNVRTEGQFFSKFPWDLIL